MDAALEVGGVYTWEKVWRSGQDQEQLSRAVVKIKSHCQAQVAIDKIKSRAEQKQASGVIVRSNR